MLHLYTLATPNGQKVSIALEELGLAYEVHRIDIMKGDQFDPEYVKINPNSKIPSLRDTEGPGGKPISIMESGAILIYLAEKTGRLLPNEAHARCAVLQWLFFQVAHIGPMFGQFGHFFKYAKAKCDHPYPLERYTNEAKRLLAVLDTQLAKSGDWLVGDFSIADIATCPWVNCLDVFYEGKDQLGLSEFKHVAAWRDRFNGRSGVQRGAKVGA